MILVLLIVLICSIMCLLEIRHIRIGLIELISVEQEEIKKREEQREEMLNELKELWNTTYSNFAMLKDLTKELDAIRVLAASPMTDEQYKVYIKWLEDTDDKGAEEALKELRQAIKEGKCDAHAYSKVIDLEK